MTTPRKTIRVADLVADVNRRNRESTCSAEMRMGWNHFLEDILFRTDSYGGYLYLRESDVPEGQLPGITGEWPGEHSFPDDSRRRYFLSSRVQHTETLPE